MTARELGKLARHIIRTYPDYYTIYGEPEFTWNKIRQQNRNPLLTMNIGADGLKTGFTKEAGYGLVGSAVQNGTAPDRGGQRLKRAKERADEAKKLLEWGFKSFESRPLFAEGQIIGDAKLFGGAAGRVPLVGERRRSACWCRKLVRPRSRRASSIPARCRRRSQQGQPIGTLKVWRGDTSGARGAAAGRRGRRNAATCAQRAFDAATELVIGLFRAGVTERTMKS